MIEQVLAWFSRGYFISHSYRDHDAVETLQEWLPSHIRPVRFPPVELPPDRFVSERLVSAILRCKGLIYLTTPASAASFWVAFERDTAARAGRRVFRADMTRQALQADNSPALDLRVFASYSHRDKDHVRSVADFMARKRHFNLWLDAAAIPPAAPLAETLQATVRDYSDRGFVVAFWSEAAAQSRWVEVEIRETVQTGIDVENRLVIARLDATPLADALKETAIATVQLFGDTERSASHRIDDLIVRLHWLFYRKHQGTAL